MNNLGWLASDSIEHLKLAIEVGHVGVWELDLKSGQAWRNERHDQIFGYPEQLPEWSYAMFLDHVVPEDRERIDTLQRKAIDQEEDWVFECRIIRADGVERWISAAGKPLRNEEGEVAKLIGHVIDNTEVKRNESRLQVLTDELNHRVRNMLAMIRAMVSLSARTSSSLASFAKALEGRVAALARSHDLVVSKDGQSFRPGEIVEQELAAFEEFKDRMHLDLKTRARLSASQAQGFSLVIHELLTNAIKYGAFSNEEGRVYFEAHDGEDGKLIASWTEIGGPDISPDRGTGFGTRMMRGALGDKGRVDMDFSGTGLVCRFEMEC